MSSPRVILVEDESLVAMMMEDLLAELGCQVIATFATLSVAMEWLAAQICPPDGALLDVNLGGELVFPLADALLARDTPFAFVTGYGAVPDPAYAASPVIHKPVTPEALMSVLKRFLPGA